MEGKLLQFNLLLLLFLLTFTSCDSKDSPLRQQESSLLLKQGNEFLIKEKMDSAMMCYTIVADRFRPDMNIEQKRQVASALNGCGFLLYHVYGNLPEASERLLFADSLCIETGDEYLGANVSLNLAIVGVLNNGLGLNNTTNEYTSKYFCESFDRAERSNNWFALLNAFSNMATQPILGNKTPKGYAERLNKFGTLNIPESIPNKEFYVNRWKAAMIALSGNREQLLSFLRKQQQNTDSLTEGKRIDLHLLNEISTTFKPYNPDSALIYAYKALSAANENRNLYDKIQIYKTLSEAYAVKKDDTNSQTALVTYYQLKDSAFEEYNLNMMQNIDKVFSIKQANVELNYKAVRNEKRMWFASFIAILTLVTVPMIIVLIRRNKALRESYIQLYNKQQELMLNWSKQREGQMKSTQIDSGIRHRTLATDETKYAIDKILSVMDVSEEIFTPEFSLDRLSELTGIRPRILSSILNESMHKTFYQLLNEYRVREACRRLEDDKHYGNLTIEAISQTLGYKSRTTLINVFKKETGLTPTEYQKIARQNKMESNNVVS